MEEDVKDFVNTVPSRSEEDDIRETVDRMYHREVAIIQREIAEAREKMVAQTLGCNEPEYYDATCIIDNSGVIQLAVMAHVEKAVADLKADAKTAIAALQKLRRNRINNYYRWLEAGRP